MNKPTYRYWLFYYKNTNELYAYTDNQDLYKSFKHERDMNKFICIEKDLSKEEVNFLASDYNYNILKKVRLLSKYGNKYKTCTIELILTQMEEMTVINQSVELITVDIFKYCWLPADIFKKDIRKSMKRILYTKIHDSMIHHDINVIETESELSIKADELGLFLRIYGKTMNMKGE